MSATRTSSRGAARSDDDAPRPGLSARLSEAASIGSPTATIAHWASIALIVVAVFVPRLLPCVDYPQHLGLADVARRLLFEPNAPEHARFQLNLFTYNGLFHLLVALLARVMPILVAGRIVVAGSLLLQAIGVVALLKALRRPAWYAVFYTPFLFSFSFGFGFMNFGLGLALAMVTLVYVARALERPTVGSALAIALLALACAFTHVLGALVLCLFAASIAPEVAWRSTRSVKGALVRVVVALAPLLLMCVWCVLVYRRQYAWNPSVYKEPTLEGTAPPIWRKLLLFSDYATGLYPDFSDQVIDDVAIVALIALAIVAWRRRKRSGLDRGPLVPFVAFFVAYLAVPMIFIGTYFIFPRLAQPLVVAALLAMPRVEPVPRPIRTTAFVAATFASLLLVTHLVIFSRESRDLADMIDAAPRGRRASAIVYDQTSLAWRNRPLVHLAGYYGALDDGDWAYSFARYQSVPVIFRAGGSPGWPKNAWEFAPTIYDPRSTFARTYDLAFVHAPQGFEEHDLRVLLFHAADADRPRLLDHRGRFWLFDTAGFPSDGDP